MRRNHLVPNRRFISLVLAALVVAALLAGCGGNDDDAATTTTRRESTSTSDRATATTVAPAGFAAKAIAAGDQHACAIDADGGAYCWGYDRMGQLGNGGDAEDESTPVAVAGSTRFASISAGRYFSCGLTAAGAAWCWGDNSAGGLGDGTTGKGGPTQNRTEPVEVQGGLSFVQLTTGQLHACGRTAAGDVHCWGAYAAGQLGNGAGEDQVRPVPSAVGLRFTWIDASGTNTCGIDEQGAAWCWGSNNFGQLGNGATTNARQPAPTRVGGDLRLTTLTVGRTHVCGLDADGAAWCWGGNAHGQLGDGTTEPRLQPTKVVTELRFSALSAGVAHTCGIARGGAAHCWGAGGDGQLGDGTDDEDRAAPVAVKGGLSFRSLAAGEAYTCGIADDASVHCWGANVAGGLGAGLDRGSAVPVAVSPPS